MGGGGGASVILLGFGELLKYKFSSPYSVSRLCIVFVSALVELLVMIWLPICMS